MKGKPIRAVFWALVGVFVIVIGIIFVTPPAVKILLPPSFFTTIFFAAMGVFVLLGAALLFLTVKEKVGGKLQKFLLLTGASAVGLPVFALLHNAVSGLTNFEEPVFFILAAIVCPIGCLVGVVGTIVLANRNKQTEQ